jgi:hypothetical protein
MGEEKQPLEENKTEINTAFKRLKVDPETKR